MASRRDWQVPEKSARSFKPFCILIWAYLVLKLSLLDKKGFYKEARLRMGKGTDGLVCSGIIELYLILRD